MRQQNIILIVCFTLFCNPVFANTFIDLDTKLLNNELDSAKTEIDKMYLTRSIVTTTLVKILREYEYVYNTLFYANNIIEKLNKIDSYENFDYRIIIDRSYKDYCSQWAIMPKKMHISKKLIDHINALNKNINEKYKSEIIFYDIAEKKRKDEIESARIEELKRIEAENEAERIRQFELNKSAEEEENNRIKKQKEKTDKIFKIVKNKGYKSLNLEYGICRFLINSMGKGSLKSGINQVFWINLSDDDSFYDSKWRLVQIVNGLEIYEINQWQGNEVIRLSIGIKTKKKNLSIEGQKLKNEFYVFKGNSNFITVLGSSRIIQIFEPVNIDPKLF